jgi:endonuclease/exonuclease/phosphatase family metal-dependent hydrolase
MKKIVFFFALVATLSIQAESYISYNLGLAHKFVHFAKERRPYLIEALKNEKADYLCLQEVWEDSDRKAIKKALKDVYPHSFYTETKQTRTPEAPSCRRKELFGEEKFVTCMNEKCQGKEGDQHTDCVLSLCQKPLKDLRDSNPMCAQALMAQVGKSPLMAIATIMNPIVPAGIYVYEGSDGLMILARKPLENVEVIDLSSLSTLNRRRAIKATVGGVNIACTHLAADLEKEAPYTGKFSSWKEEHREQSKELIKQAELKKVSLLMGDFNCSFGAPNLGILAEVEDNCELFKQAGYADPIAEISPECTFCQGNNLNDDETRNVLIDHIFSKGVDTKNTEVLFKEKVFMDKIQQESNLSDHYGVLLEI